MKKGTVTALLLSISLFVPSKAQDKNSAGRPLSQFRNNSSRKVVEHEIAGLRPGGDTIEKAYHRFGKNILLSQPGSAVWVDHCNHQMLTVAFNPNGIIREIEVEPPPWGQNIDCSPGSYSRGVRARMGGTGRGLVLRDRCDRVREVYGAPLSEGRFNGDNKGREFVYRFDRAVKGSTLILEITCDSALSRVEKIKLTVLEDSSRS